MILFLSLHGSAKSLIASVHFNRLAEKRGVAVRAVSAGLEPDSEVPEPVVSGLARDGIDVRGYQPMLATAAQIATASGIVSFGCDIPPAPRVGTGIERWDDVPMVSDGYAAARDIIVVRVNQLLDIIQLQKQSQNS